jgi:hypothetical protein
MSRSSDSVSSIERTNIADYFVDLIRSGETTLIAELFQQNLAQRSVSILTIATIKQMRFRLTKPPTVFQHPVIRYVNVPSAK